MKTIIIDNFLPYPNVVRSWALNQQFYNCQEFSKLIGTHTSWPGTRTEHVMDLDIDYTNSVLNQLSNIVRKSFLDLPVNIRSYFQICTEHDGDSWIHQDNDVSIAAVLYLSPDAPCDSGTTLYRCNDLTQWHNLTIDQMKQINSAENKSLYHSLFTPVDQLGNVFNRLVIYRGDEFHKSSRYFGSNKEDGRLTQVFFIKYES